ncbi:Uncharacterised protein [Vibrio cholerae]|nr:Uncharacterised protein [Vibrio cholerae]
MAANVSTNCRSEAGVSYVSNPKSRQNDRLYALVEIRLRLVAGDDCRIDFYSVYQVAQLGAGFHGRYFD